MSKSLSTPTPDSSDEIAGLVRTLHETQERLRELTGGQVDAVLHRDGQSYLLHQAQGKLRASEITQRELASTMTAILNALPAHIALLDEHGVIVSVNDSWRTFTQANVLGSAEFVLRQNYVEICEKVIGECAEDAHAAAKGIRRVLGGEIREFTLEYPCHSPTEQRWFQLLVTPMAGEPPSGAVVMHLNITERKLAEESMRQSEERFRNMFDSAATGIAISTPLGRYLRVNAAYCRMLDYTEEELLARDFASVTHPDDLTLNVQVRDEILAGQRESFVMEKRYLKKGGDVVWTRHSVSATHGPDGKVATMIAVAEDITDRKLAEQALQATAGSLAVSQRIAHLGSWEMDLVHPENLRANPLRWSDEMYRIMGYEPQAMSVTPDFYLEHVPGEDRALIERRLLEILHDRQQRSYFYPIKRADGAMRTVHTQAQVLLDEKTQRPFRLFGTLHDVTEAKLNEEQRRAETALLEAQLNSTLDGILIVGPERKVLLQNQRLVELWQMPPEIEAETDHRRRFEWSTRQIKNLAPYVERVEYLYDHPDETGRDEVELIDGTFFDRYTAPVRGRDGRYYGRIWVYRDITERKMAEKKAAEQVELITMAGRVGKLGAWAAEYPGPRLVWSEELYRIHEVEPGFVPEHESALSFFIPESRRRLEAAIAAKKPYDLELGIVTAKGNNRWVRTTSAVDMKDGEVTRLYGVLQDVTDRKQNEIRIRRLIDSNVQGVLFWSKNGAINYANDSFLRLVGYTRAELEERRIDWRALTPPEYDEIDRRALDEIAVHGVCKPYEKEFIRKDGSRVPVLIGSATFEGQPDEGVCFVLDLTERKRAETRLRRLVDSNAQGVFFWNTQGEVLEANDAFLQISGYTREDLQAGRIDWKGITPPEYAAADEKALEEIAARGSCTPYQKEYIRKDGKRVPILVGAASFEDNPNEGVRFVLDLSDQKKLEQQFLRAQRMESIGTLAGGIAHDLNNILAPIMMAVQVLKMSATNPQSKSILETIEVSSKRGADIVRQVLSFARGLQGERIEVQPVHLLKDIEAIIRDTFPKNIRREIFFPEDSWTILGDPTQLHQILLNLCVNARDAMPDGGSLTIAVENAYLDDQYVAMNIQAKPGRYVAINVSDSGSGIPPEILDKIFEPFFTTKDVGKGTGLGLSTVMAIVKSHGGFVNVYSELGKGSSFRVYLPATEASTVARQDTVPLGTLPRGNGERILIVDDETSILTITSQTLEAFGYKTTTAADGAEAIAIYAQDRNNIAAILTDMAMPVMDGPATIRALLRINPAVKIIAATGLKTEGSEAKALNAGVKYFLSKPYTAETLLKTLRTALDEGKKAK